MKSPVVGQFPIEEYLEFYRGPGVQHIAMATDNILETVATLRRNGVEARVGKIDEPISELRELGVLVDRDDEGYMLQQFTRPVDRPTLFYEVIQRKGRRSSGSRRDGEICRAGDKRRSPAPLFRSSQERTLGGCYCGSNRLLNS